MSIPKASKQPAQYRLRLKGSFDEARLAYWFEGFTVTRSTAGETTLEGTLPDEAALHGLLAKVNQLGLELLLVERIKK